MFHKGLFLLDLYYFFFNDTATTEIYTLSLHDALPIHRPACDVDLHGYERDPVDRHRRLQAVDRKSTRLNSSHVSSSYAVFGLNKQSPQQGHERAQEEQPGEDAFAPRAGHR